MRIEVIFCPSCQHKLRIPDDLMGQPVQCPECRAMFLSPPPPVNVRGPEQEDGERPPVARPELGLEEDDRREREPQPQDNGGGRASGPGSPAARVRGPALALLLIGICQFLLNAQAGVQAFSNPEGLRQKSRAIAQALMPGMPAPPFDVARLTLILSAVFALISLLQAVGGFAMLQRRRYGLAVVGSVAAMLNCVQICCVVGVPVGIWSLFLLFQPGVRQSFR